MKNFKKSAFTLIELIITISIVVILSTISAPIYRYYVSDAKQAEGYMLLGSIRDAQLQYLSEYRNFLKPENSSIGNKDTFTYNESVLGINAGENRYFTSFCLSTVSDDGSNFTAYAGSADVGTVTMIFDLTTGTSFM